MNKNILFDHTYTDDEHHRFLNQLIKYGFDTNYKSTVHPGYNRKFLRFSNGKYLEFAHGESTRKRMKSPGISFRYQINLFRFYKNLKEKNIPCKFEHRNYEWYVSIQKKLPGWNFLKFPKRGFSSFYPWFTEYELNPKLPKNSKRRKNIIHKNKVYKIVGHEFIINQKGLEFFETILNCKIKKCVTLPCGTILYFKNGRVCRHTKVILGTKNLKTTHSFMQKAPLINYDGKNAIYIKNLSPYKKMWDIVIVKD